MFFAEKLMQTSREIVVDIPGLEDQIRTLRESDKRSVRKIASAAGMSPVHWYRIESGKQKLREETLRRIEEVFGVDFGIQFDG